MTEELKDKWGSWRRYVEQMGDDFRELREVVTKLRIELAVVKTKLAIYVIIIAFGATTLTNLIFLWLRTKI